MSNDWRSGVPVLRNGHVTLRELRLPDAEYLSRLLAPDEVSRFISPPPPTASEFERFIRWSHEKRSAGQLASLGLVPNGLDDAVGVFQLQMLTKPEWGFVIGKPLWQTGLFSLAAEAFLQFVFEDVGLTSIGARIATENDRGNRVMERLGAVCEGIIPNGLVRNGRPFDQFYWRIRGGAE